MQTMDDRTLARLVIGLGLGSGLVASVVIYQLVSAAEYRLEAHASAAGSGAQQGSSPANGDAPTPPGGSRRQDGEQRARKAPGVHTASGRLSEETRDALAKEPEYGPARIPTNLGDWIPTEFEGHTTRRPLVTRYARIANDQASIATAVLGKEGTTLYITVTDTSETPLLRGPFIEAAHDSDEPAQIAEQPAILNYRAGFKHDRARALIANRFIVDVRAKPAEQGTAAALIEKLPLDALKEMQAKDLAALEAEAEKAKQKDR